MKYNDFDYVFKKMKEANEAYAALNDELSALDDDLAEVKKYDDLYSKQMEQLALLDIEKDTKEVASLLMDIVNTLLNESNASATLNNKFLEISKKQAKLEGMQDVYIDLYAED